MNISRKGFDVFADEQSTQSTGSGLAITHFYLGNESFVKKMQKKLDVRTDLSEIPRAQRRSKAKPLQYYESQYKDKKRGMVNAYTTGDDTMKEIAEYFQVHYSTVSRAIKKVEVGSA